MLSKFTRTLFGSRNDRIIKNLKQRVVRISRLEPEMQALDDTQLKQKTGQLKQRFEDGESLEDLLDEVQIRSHDDARREATCLLP